MKLSEILSKPLKVKGGGTVNLKGLSKHIVDKEVGGGEIKLYDTIDELVSDIFNAKYISTQFDSVDSEGIGLLEYGYDNLCSIGDTVVACCYFDIDEDEVLKYFTAECTEINYNEGDDDYFYSFKLIDFIDWNVQYGYVYIK